MSIPSQIHVLNGVLLTAIALTLFLILRLRIQAIVSFVMSLLLWPTT